MIEQLKKYDVWVYIAVAYLFSVVCRLLYVYHVGDSSGFYWNGELMLNTNDGYFWASGVKNLLDHSMTDNYRVPGLEYGMVAFTYFLAKILPFSLETVTFYLPVMMSSIIVVPIILIMKLYNKAFIGFLAALLAAITWSFYNRTMAGYYDSDIFALLFPIFIVYFLMRALREKSLVSFFTVMLLNALYFYAYDASRGVIYGIGLGFIAYALIFLRKESKLYEYIFLISISMLDIDWRVRLFLIILSWVLVYKGFLKEKKVQIGLALLALLSFLYFNNVFLLIWGKVYEYIQTGVAQSSGLKFFQVHQTISEAEQIPFTIFADRISGSVIGFFIAMLGYLVLVWRKKEFLLFLPLIAIGFFAYKGGLRFTVYAIPALSIGAIYLFWELAKFIDRKDKRVQYGVVLLAAIAFLYPNIKHIFDYNKRIMPVFSNVEVQDLDKLKKLASNKDYTLSWWDYGYPIWYYSGTNTLIDGGKHQNDNYIVSKILQSDSPELMANLSRVAIENYVEAVASYKNYIKHNKDEKFIPKKFKLFNGKTPYHAVGNGNGAVVETLFEGGAKESRDPQELLRKLSSTDYPIGKKTRDIYIYMPNKMMNIFSTVMLFGNLDLKTGEPLREALYYAGYIRKSVNSKLFLTNGLVFDQQKGLIYFGRKALKVKNFITTQNLRDGSIKVMPKIYHRDGQIAVVYLKTFRKLLVMDLETFASNYVQMGILGNYDKSLFELVVKSPYSRIYRVKR